MGCFLFLEVTGQTSGTHNSLSKIIVWNSIIAMLCANITLILLVQSFLLYKKMVSILFKRKWLQEKTGNAENTLLNGVEKLNIYQPSELNSVLSWVNETIERSKKRKTINNWKQIESKKQSFKNAPKFGIRSKKRQKNIVRSVIPTKGPSNSFWIMKTLRNPSTTQRIALKSRPTLKQMNKIRWTNQ